MFFHASHDRADIWARWIALAAILGCVAIVVTTGLAAAGVLPGLTIPKPPASGYPVGSQIDVVGDWFGSSHRSVLLFVRTDCAVTMRASGFIGQVRRRFSSGAVAVRLVVPGERTEAEMQFARDAGFTNAQVGIARFADLALEAVPALVVTDAKGTVLWQSIVPVDPERGTEMLAELSRIIED